MVEKENIPSAASAKANKTEERRKQLEDYVRAKREKRYTVLSHEEHH